MSQIFNSIRLSRVVLWQLSMENSTWWCRPELNWFTLYWDWISNYKTKTRCKCYANNQLSCLIKTILPTCNTAIIQNWQQCYLSIHNYIYPYNKVFNRRWKKSIQTVTDIVISTHAPLMLQHTHTHIYMYIDYLHGRFHFIHHQFYIWDIIRSSILYTNHF